MRNRPTATGPGPTGPRKALPPRRGHACFPTPVVDAAVASLDASGEKIYLPPENAGGAAGDPELELLKGLRPERALGVFADSEVLALARFLPSLLCGEESAVVIFLHESKRFGREQKARIQASMARLAGEEERHEIMLRRLYEWMPKAPDLDRIHKRATDFFVGLGFASASPEERLAHISALDACVSLTLGYMVKDSPLRRSELFVRVVDRIRRDEARHVRVCRRHLEELDVGRTQQQDAGNTVRARFIDLLTPVADSFDDMGLDADRLFTRIRRRTGL